MGFPWYWFSGAATHGTEYLFGKILTVPLSIILGTATGVGPSIAVFFGNGEKVIWEAIYLAAGLGFGVSTVGTCYAGGMVPALVVGSFNVVYIGWLTLASLANFKSTGPDPPYPKMLAAWVIGTGVSMYGFVKLLSP